MSGLNKSSDYGNRRSKIAMVCGLLLVVVIAPIVFLLSVVPAFISVHEQGFRSNEEWFSYTSEATGRVKSFSIITGIVGLLLFVMCSYRCRKNRAIISQTGKLTGKRGKRVR